MLRVGLTGGIGSGKSSVAALLLKHGAEVIDADLVAREVVAAGTPALAAISARFGAQVLLPDGSLDRAGLGRIVFADPAALADLEAITHPAISARTAELFREVPVDEVVVHDVPLLVEKGMSADYHLVIAVLAPEEVRVRRLVELRGMTEADAAARIAAQATDQQRRVAADIVIDNSGSAADLRATVDALWHDRLDPYDDNLLSETRAKRPQSPPMPITSYRPEWPVIAERLMARIIRALDAVETGGTPSMLEHIGSTAVPGLAAKDVIDLQLTVTSLDVADRPEWHAALTQAGYAEVPENRADNGKDGTTWPKRFFGSMDPGQFVHLHVREAGSPGAEFAVAFREWLRAHPDQRDAYAAVKRELADTAADTTSYAHSKEPWFDQSYPTVMAWWHESGRG